MESPLQLLDQIARSWSDPQMRHAMWVHFPIVLSLLAGPATLAAALIGTRFPAVRWTALALTVLLAGCAWAASQSGEDAEEVAASVLSTEALEVLQKHEELGEWVSILASGAALFLLLSTVDRKPLRLLSAWLAVVLATAALLWTAGAAHHGGQLVYEHGAAVSSR